MASNTRRLILSGVGALVVIAAGIAAFKTYHDIGAKPTTTNPTPSGAGDATRKRQVYDFKRETASKAGVPLRPMDIDILDAIAEKDLSRNDLLDLFPDRPYHVKLVSSPDKWISFVLIDLERDNKLDERWEMKPDTVVRVVVQPDNPGGIPFALRPGHWVPY